MPLLEPTVAREPIHTRRIECRGYRRADGLWDIEGHLVDTKAYGFDNKWRGHLAPGTPLHEMRLRLTLDDSYLVHAVDAATDASPFQMCPDIVPNFQALVGLRIGKGWRKQVQERLGGVKGCTHLIELALGAMATAAIQTIVPVRSKEATSTEQRSGFVDTCHALAADSPVVAAHWPQFYTGKP
jgi:hypothetical protein